MKTSFLKRIFPADWWKTPAAVWAVTGFATLLCFDILWCSQTTFRAMSDWMLYACNLLAALLLAMPRMLTRGNILQTVLWLIVDAVLISNLMYCRTYYTAIPPDSYALVSNLADFTASVTDSFRFYYLLLPLITVAGCIIARRRARSGTALPAKRRWTFYGAYALALAVIISVGLACRGGFFKEYNRLVESCYYTTCGVPTYTVAGHVAYTLLDNAEALTPQKQEFVNSWLADHKALFPHEPLPDSIPGRKNLVVILCESLESWVIGAEVDGKPITPFLNSLVADSTTLFAPQMLTQVGSGRSIDCQLLLDAGVPPMLTSVYSMKYPDHNYPSLIKAMKREKGASSWLLTCDKPVVWNQEPIARAFGFDSILHRDAWTIDEQVGNPPKLSDGSFMRQSVEKLSRGDIWPVGSPSFLQFVTYSGHNPFRLPEKLHDAGFRPDAARWPQRFIDYVTMAHYTDAQLATLVNHIKSRPDYAETAILITGDHEGLAADRAELLAHKEAGKIVSPGQYTPFIVVNSPVPGRFDFTMGQVDMYPTLLNIMRLDSYPHTGLGVSIFSPHHPHAAVSSADNSVQPSSATLSPEVQRHLLDARKVSDILIRHDILP